jgi:hypothetical protein
LRELKLNIKKFADDKAVVGLVLPLFAEIKRRQKHPFYHYKPDDHPDRNQLAFHQSDASIRLVFGGNQSGKSRAVAQEIAWWLTESHPHQKTPPKPRIYCLSAGYRTLQEGLYRHLREILPEWLLFQHGANIAGWDMPAYIRLKNGAQVDFISGDEEVDQVLYEELQARRITRAGRVVVAATLVRSEDWCVNLEEQAEAGNPDVFLVRLSTFRARDAGHVSARVIKEMENSLPPEELEVRLSGKSRKSEGRVYPEFARMHVMQPIPIPREWPRYCAIDPGWRTAAALWAAVAPDGRYLIYRELYYHGANYLQLAHAWFAASGYKRHPSNADLWVVDPDHTENIEVTWIDPSAFRHETSGSSGVGVLLAQSGLPCAPARNDVDSGIELCRTSLMPGLGGIPRMRVFDTCTNFIQEARSYRRPKDTRDMNHAEKTARPIKRKDHLMDCWRYLELGGLDARGGMSLGATPNPDLAKMPTINARHGLQEYFEREWLSILKKQREGGRLPQHIGGLGAEY